MQAGLVRDEQPDQPRQPQPQMDESADHRAAFREARRLAVAQGRPPASADLLLGLLHAGGAAARLLTERGVAVARLGAVLSEVRAEPGFDLDAVDRTSRDVASQVGAPQRSSIHLLVAILRGGGSATDLLRRAGHDPGRIRSTAMRALTGPGRIAERLAAREPQRVPASASPAAEDPRAAQPATATTTPAIDAHLDPSAAAGSTDVLPLDPPTIPVLHRERELGRLLDLLKASPGHIACVVGDPGSGRSALLAALAAASPERPVAPSARMIAGGSLGAWLQALDGAAPIGVPLVLDGCAALGFEGSDGPAQLVALARAGRRFVFAATPADVRRFEINAPDLASRLEAVPLHPLPPDALYEVIENAMDQIADGAGLPFAPAACRTIIRLSPRYPSERAEPGRSIGVAELAAGRAARLGRPAIGDREIAEVVADAAGIVPERLLRTDEERWRSLETRLAGRVVGHDAARSRIAEVLRRSHAGFRGRRPLASLLLLGPTGVGKTETARAVADSLYDGEAALLRIDLSEYSEPHAVARLIGSPPGYVGHEDGGQLTEGVRRRPASVILLDEIEKAHREVLLLLLQVLEDGRLTDGRGRTVDFSASVVVMTSNLGSELYFKSASRAPAASTVLALARSRLPPELWNRIDETLCFSPLREPDLRRVVALLAADSSRRLETERGIRYAIDDDVIDEVLAQEADRTLGARPLRRAYERLVEGHIASEILAGRVREGAFLQVSRGRKGQLVVTLNR